MLRCESGSGNMNSTRLFAPLLALLTEIRVLQKPFSALHFRQPLLTEIISFLKSAVEINSCVHLSSVFPHFERRSWRIVSRTSMKLEWGIASVGVFVRTKKSLLPSRARTEWSSVSCLYFSDCKTFHCKIRVSVAKIYYTFSYRMTSQFFNRCEESGSCEWKSKKSFWHMFRNCWVRLFGLRDSFNSTKEHLEESNATHFDSRTLLLTHVFSTFQWALLSDSHDPPPCFHLWCMLFNFVKGGLWALQNSNEYRKMTLNKSVKSHTCASSCHGTAYTRGKAVWQTGRGLCRYGRFIKSKQQRNKTQTSPGIILWLYFTPKKKVHMFY